MTSVRKDLVQGVYTVDNSWEMNVAKLWIVVG